MRYVLSVRERRAVQCVRLFAQGMGKGVVERGVRPREKDDGWEECVRAVRRIGRPGPVRENAAVEWFEGGGDGESFVKMTKASTPQLQACCRFTFTLRMD